MSTSTTSPQTTSRSGLRAWPASPSLALLVLRLAVGAVFIAHGAQKVFVYGFAGTSGSFADMGVPLAEVAGPVVALLELIGGVLLVLGLGTRIAAAALAVDMLVATLLVHLTAGIFVAEGGYELTLVLGATAVALVLAGAGRYSVDAALAQRRTARV
ncbi:DoxX family protein [Cryobacterium sp. 1639]|uniref:DoxX family protein n=1 Tax=Cryobacterium inferilacus TaxID=2866629 RepID=UPI001C7323BC|nr:DoxX family protein [Cryobacterium sp. 1639]MBX0301118.1 DoxX family protein [Cryobacterium sp. 1639]